MVSNLILKITNFILVFDENGRTIYISLKKLGIKDPTYCQYDFNGYLFAAMCKSESSFEKSFFEDNGYASTPNSN